MFGLERDQQNPDPVIATTTIFRILKDRYTGRSTGKTLLLGFHQESGKLFVREEDPFETKGASDHGFENETPDF
ncbi:hypothetical protein CN175_15855 [Sinorhizobium meliloti]|nr:hypothetical protein CN175_15855 [Sinorhizobium meliloti]